MFSSGTILMALYGQGKTRGQVGVLGIDAATNQACAAIMPDHRLDVEYLYQFLKGSYVSIRALSNTGGNRT
jgi:type I restriction enzyme S subunit